MKNIAILGATGNVGREILQVLAERGFPATSVQALASSESLGTEISYGDDHTLKVQSAEHFDYSKVDYVLSSIGSKAIQNIAPQIAAAGAILIDNSSAFRTNPNIPLVVPEVNFEDLKMAHNENIVANPNCVAIPLCMALKPLHNISSIKRVVVSTYQSTSGAGRKAMDELFRQSRDIFMNNSIVKEEFTKQIAFNVIPHIGEFNSETGFTGEEEKVMSETRKMISENIGVIATCVRVPTFIGHAISASIEFHNSIDFKEAKKALSEAPGVIVVDHRVDEGYVTPVECAGEDGVYLSRIRKDPTVPNGISLWIVSDNLRKGAALNAVQILESLISSTSSM